jgi:protein-S-isoprenylcysteine O-methyltransferase Ste14
VTWPAPIGSLQLYAFAWVVVVGACALLTTILRNRKFGDTAKKSRASSLGIAIQAVAFFLAAYGPTKVSLPWTSPASLASTAFVLIFGIGAVLLFISAARAMGRNWSVVARTRADHQLVRTGPFALVRHPIYLALLLYLISIGAAFGHWLNLLLAVPVSMIGTLIRVREEERLLQAQFGEDHARYVREVPAFIPFIR